MKLPCDCEEDMEHEVDISAEVGGYGARAQIGLYSPTIGDRLPCGRLINQKDIDYIFEYLDHLNVNEG